VSQEDAQARAFGWRFTGPLLLGATLNPINTSMIATALVGIGVDMHAGPAATSGLISILYLCSAVAQPTMGKLSTLFGARRVFLTGILILLIGGVLGTAAPALRVLMISRALIGVGTAACFPTAMALVRRRADTAGIGVPSAVLGNFSIAGQVTALVGLPLGGFLAGAFGWRAIFAVNIPLAIVSFVLALAGVAKDPPLANRTKLDLLSAIDVPGIGLFAGAIACLLLFLAHLAAANWPWLIIAIAFCMALFFWERSIESPLIDFKMLADNAPLQRTYLRQTLSFLASYTVLYGASQWMEQSRHLSASVVGLAFLPMSLLSIAIARLISSRRWLRWPLIAAGAALATAAAWMLAIDARSSVSVLVCMTLLVGVANGCSGFGNQAALYIQSPAHDIAVASGLLRTAMYLGAIFSSSMIGLAFGSAATDSGFHTLAWSIGAIGVATASLAAWDASLPNVAR
jgi:MFS family permease